MRVKIFSILISISFILVSFTSCSSLNNSLNTTNNDAPSGELKILCMFYDVSFCKEAGNIFQKKTGINVSAEGTNNMTYDEIKNNIKNYDILLGGDTDYYFSEWKDELYPYISKYSRPIDNAYKEKNGYYTGIGFSPIIFCSNKQKLAKYSLLPPNAWNTLLNEEYLKGGVAYNDPYSSGNGFESMLAYYNSNGGEPEAAEKFFEKLDKYIPNYPRYEGDLAKDLVDNKITTVLIKSSRCLQLIDLQHPLVLSYPEEGTSYVVDGIAISKKARNLNEAKQFVDYSFQPEAQEILQKLQFLLPINPNIPLASENKALLNLPILKKFSDSNDKIKTRNDFMNLVVKNINVDYKKKKKQ